MGKPGAIVVTFVVDKHLGLVLQAAKRGRVQDAVAIALVDSPVAGFVVGIRSALGLAASHSVGRQVLVLEGFQHLAGEDRGRCVGAHNKLECTDREIGCQSSRLTVMGPSLIIPGGSPAGDPGHVLMERNGGWLS